MIEMGHSPGIFIVSLDFELYWGIFDKAILENKFTYFQNTRAIIPEVLKIFNRYQIRASWAAIGMLMAKNWDDWEQLNPQVKPQYENIHLDSYRLSYLYRNRTDLLSYFFAPNLLRLINQQEGQEIATHTYSHYYCHEKGQTEDTFSADLGAVMNASQKLGLPAPVSLVFPRNQFKENYLKICKMHGISIVRSNPNDWFWQDTGQETLLKKVFRTGDAFMQIGHRKSFSKEGLDFSESILQIPASRFFRPVSKKKILNTFRLQRILNEMEYAAKNKLCYHLWWHPHNFGNYPQESISDLIVVMEKYKELHNKYGMLSFAMKDFIYAHPPSPRHRSPVFRNPFERSITLHAATL
jgi:peptidoglycan/xylan/chitin deacetylase (PgdA/CDA1 family)